MLPQHADYNVERARNVLAPPLSSADLRHWTTETILLYHPSITDHGFQYPFFQFDGDDLIAAVRTAYDDGLGGADNQHNANFLTFHRFENFRGPWPPAFDRQPAEQAVPSGNAVCFSVEAHNGTLSFQWYKQTPDQPDEQLTDNSRISGAATSQLCIANVLPEDEALYYCVATNEIASTPSSPAALVVAELRPTIRLNPTSPMPPTAMTPFPSPLHLASRPTHC